VYVLITFLSTGSTRGYRSNWRQHWQCTS